MYLFIDTETGGLDPKHHSLLDITLLIADGEKSLADLSQTWRRLHLDLLSSDGIYHVDPNALRKNGINLADRNVQLYTYEAAALEIHSFLVYQQKRLTPVGWNLPFDLGFIYSYIMDKHTWDNKVGYRTIDLQSVARMLTDCGVIKPKGNSLVHVAEYFGIDTSGAHSSIFDVNMMYEVFLKLRALLGGVNGTTDPFSKQTEALPVLPS